MGSGANPNSAPGRRLVCVSVCRAQACILHKRICCALALCLVVAVLLFYLVPPRPSHAEEPGDVLITEVMIKPRKVADDQGEWLELTNLGQGPVNMAGWSLIIGEHRYLISDELQLNPGQYAVLANRLDPDVNGGVHADYRLPKLRIPNRKGTISLLAPSGKVVDEVSWDEDTGHPAPAGATLERQNAARSAPWGPAHSPWAGSSGDYGSPGAPYAPLPPTATPIPSSTPEPTATPVPTTTPLPPTATPTASPTAAPPTSTPAPPTDTPAPTPTDPPPTQPHPQHPPRIRLSEIMANPAAVDDDAGEWLELFHAGTTRVNLNGWILSDLDMDRHVIGADLWIEPGEYVVLGRNGDMATNGGVSARYVYDSLALANETDELILSAPWGGEADRLLWGEGTDLRIRKGASLERTGFSQGFGWIPAQQPWSGSSSDLGSPGAPYSPPPAPTPTPVLPSVWDVAGTESPLMIDEVYVDGSEHEYIVLRNIGSSSLDLSGWHIADAEVPGDGEGIHALPPGVVLSPGALLVMARNGPAFAGRWGFTPDAEWEERDASIPTLARSAAWANGSLELRDTGDEILLLNPAMQIADAVAYGDGHFDAARLTGALRIPDGQSLQCVPGYRYPTQPDVRYRFLVAPPEPQSVRSLPSGVAGNHPALGGLFAVWGTLGAHSSFSEDGHLPPQYLVAAAAANGLDFVAIADEHVVHAANEVNAASSTLYLPAWRWRNAEGAAAVIYGPHLAPLQTWSDLREYLETHGIVAQAQVSEPPSVAGLVAIGADRIEPDNLTPLLNGWRTTGRAQLPAGNAIPPVSGLDATSPRYTGLAVDRRDTAGVLAALAERRGWLTSVPGLSLALRIADGPWMGQTITAANEVVLEVHYADRSGQPAGIALWQDDRPVHQFDSGPDGGVWTVRVPAVPGSFLFVVATQSDGDFAVTAPLMVERSGEGRALLNEVLPSPWEDWNKDGVVDSDDEFVELHNDTDAPLALEGWRLSDASGEDSPGRHFVFGPGRFLPAQGRLLLWRAETRLNLNNDGDYVRLHNASGAIVDEIGWAQPPGEGLSIARIPDGGSWVAGTDVTPGSANRMPDGSVEPPRPGSDGNEDDGGTEIAEIAVKVEQGQAVGAPGSLADAKLRGLGAEVEFRARVVAPPGLFNSSIYVAEPAGAGNVGDVAGLGIQVYLQDGLFAEMAEGDEVLVRGRLHSFRGELEAIANEPSQVWRIDGSTPLQPLPVRAYEVGETLEGRLVTFSGEVTGWQGDSIYVCDPERPDEDVRVTVRSSLDWRRPYVNKGEQWQVTGIVSQFAKEHPWNGGYRVLVRYQDDLVKTADR